MGMDTVVEMVWVERGALGSVALGSVGARWDCGLPDILGAREM